MTVQVLHNKVCGGENDPTKEVSKDAWNDYHAVTGLGSAAEADAADFAAAAHNHDADYAAIGHEHDAAYSAIGHNHDASYDAIGAADAALTSALAADFSGAYGDLTGKPTLGDAAAKNTGTGAGDVAAGNHTHAGGGDPLDAWPVGSVYIAVDSTSPATRFGGGTWSAFAAGRVLVGLDSGQTEFDVAEETGGAKTVTLTAAQSGLPQHTHTQNAHTHVQDAHTHSISGGSSDDTSAPFTGPDASTSTATAFGGGVGSTVAVNQNATATNQNAGPADASQAHNNLQPYIVVYMWKRTA